MGRTRGPGREGVKQEIRLFFSFASLVIEAWADLPYVELRYPLSFNVGIHESSSIQWVSELRGPVTHSSRHTPGTANTSRLHRTSVEINPTLLGL